MNPSPLSTLSPDEEGGSVSHPRPHHQWQSQGALNLGPVWFHSLVSFPHTRGFTENT